MPGLPVAVHGDVHATVGAGMFGSATSGSWTAGTVTEQTYTWLTVGGAAVVHAASCTFSFTGSDGMNTVTGTSTVSLTAATTVLQHGSTNVLRNGDSASDTYGNTLAVQASGILTSA
jgi:hypothetical protein